MPAGYVMTIVAHEDDDLFFVNPEIQAAVSAGVPAVTVFVTAGQASGNGDTDGDRAMNRQLGIKAAYAQMAGVPAAQWSGDVLWVAGRQVERYVLAGAVAPVEVVFCNLPDGGLDGIVNGGQTRSTVLVTAGLVTRAFTYARADVGNMLTGLMSRYQPTVVRYQDVLPDNRYIDEHADHKAVATMATQAAATHSDSLIAVPQRCYNTQYAPVNLPPADRVAKLATAQAYMAYDSAAAPSGWTERNYQRWPRGTTWTGRNADGRLQVWVVRSGQVWTWWRRTDGTWSSAVNMGAPGPVTPALTVCRNADGRLQVFARRSDTHTITSSWQTAVNGAWSGWQDMGSPNAGTSLAPQLGSPYAALSDGGLIWLFMKNGGGGVSARSQNSPNDGFGSWLDLGGSDVQDGVTAACNPGGCWEVAAATRTAILHWYQSSVGGRFILNTAFPAPVPASPPVALRATDGTVAVAYRAADTAEVTVTSQVAPNGVWSQPVTATGRPASGAVAMAAPADTTHQPMLVARDARGRVSVAWPAGSGWTWTDLPGGPFLDAPAASVDPAGTVTLVAVGFDGLVRVCTQTGAGVGKPFDSWQPLAA